MKINRQEFLQCLQAVSPGLAATRETVEQSASFVFHKNKIFTYNTELACWMKSPLKITGAVASAPLLAILDKLAEEDIDVDVAEGELMVKGHGRRAGIRMEAEVSLPIQEVEVPQDWYELHADFGEAINVAVQCTTKDESQGFRLTCVHITPKWVEACDNYQIVRYPMATGIETNTLVKREAIKHISGLGMTAFAETKTWLHFRNPQGLVLSCRRYMEDEFPDVTKNITMTGAVVNLPGGLAEAVDKALVFSADNPENDNIMIDLRANRLRVSSRGPKGRYEEIKKVAYDGPDLSFLIAPSILTEITKRHSECQVAADRLKVDGGKYVYVTALGNPEEAAPLPKPTKEEEAE